MKTRSQERRNNFQDNAENVSENVVPPLLVKNIDIRESDVMAVGPSYAKLPRSEIAALETLRTSLKEEITAEIKDLLVESQNELLKLLKPKTGENVDGKDVTGK